MDDHKSNVDKDQNIEGADTMSEKVKGLEEYKAEKKMKRMKKTFTLVTVVGVSAGLYGFKLGRRSGLRRGIEVGYLTAGKELVNAWKEHSEELRLTRGE